MFLSLYLFQTILYIYLFYIYAIYISHLLTGWLLPRSSSHHGSLEWLQQATGCKVRLGCDRTEVVNVTGRDLPGSQAARRSPSFVVARYFHHLNTKDRFSSIIQFICSRRDVQDDVQRCLLPKSAGWRNAAKAYAQHKGFQDGRLDRHGQVVWRNTGWVFLLRSTSLIWIY